METEKADVPSFDGFECIGVKVPETGDYMLDHDGYTLVEKRDLVSYARIWAQLCYRKIKPKRIILEETDAARRAYTGEWYQNGQAFVKANVDTICEYRIWREVKE